MKKLLIALSVLPVSFSTLAESPAPENPGSHIQVESKQDKKELRLKKMNEINESQIQKMDELLNLTDEQKEELRSLHQERMDFMMNHTKKMKAVFTEEQKEKLKSLGRKYQKHR